ncbi:MAG: endolytic transglycosylase MltG [Candidatus Protistobacter heckmanni]|nr:endolytic transglycosylase MltG [Candidatus Protistobacter heckmanni]
MLRKLRNLLILLILLAGSAAGGLYWWSHQPIELASPQLEIWVRPGSSLASIPGQLRAGGADVQPHLFQIEARLMGVAGHLKSGTYALEAGITLDQLLDKMFRGDVVRHTITIVEGWEFRKMRAAVDLEQRLGHNTAGMSDAQLLKLIGAQETRAEGLFFPDTYLFDVGSTDVDLYKRAYHAMQKRLAEAWKAKPAGLPYKTPYEALTMASILEKETGAAADRPLIAAVFVNRLKKGMLLQTDPTVIYGMGEAFDGNLRKRDLQTDTPYNTYTRGGLPPTPIALPGKAALAAALNPAASEALYFVARGDGTSEFSSSLAEHNRAVNTFRRHLPDPGPAKAAGDAAKPPKRQ